MKQISDLTPTELQAILILNEAKSLTRHQGAWRNGSARHRVQGITIANLRREGFIDVNRYANAATATLTRAGAEAALRITSARG